LVDAENYLIGLSEVFGAHIATLHSSLFAPPMPFRQHRLRTSRWHTVGMVAPALLRGQVEEILAVEGLQYVQLATPLVDEGAIVFGKR